MKSKKLELAKVWQITGLLYILGFKVFLQILEQEKSACKVYNRRSMLLPKVVAFKFLNNLGYILERFK